MRITQCRIHSTTEQEAVATWPTRNIQPKSCCVISKEQDQFELERSLSLAHQPIAIRNSPLNYRTGSGSDLAVSQTQSLVEWHRNGQVATASCSVVEYQC